MKKYMAILPWISSTVNGGDSLHHVWMWWTLIKVYVTICHLPKRVWVCHRLKFVYLHAGSSYPWAEEEEGGDHKDKIGSWGERGEFLAWNGVMSDRARWCTIPEGAGGFEG